MAHRTDAATRERMRRHAVRAIDDPVELAKAARIVRVALERKRLRLEDLQRDEIMFSGDLPQVGGLKS